MNIYLSDARKKLAHERREIGSTGKVGVIADSVYNALILFCEQDSEFAQAVVQTDKTLKACCDYIVKGVQNGISDIDAYGKAVEFYFPGATVKFEMRIQVNPYEEDKPSTIIDITSLL